jgi:hypothetical protein
MISNTTQQIETSHPELWQEAIVPSLSPIDLKAFSIANSYFHSIVSEYRVSLVLSNKDISVKFLNLHEFKLFSEDFIKSLKSTAFTASEKNTQIIEYIDSGRIDKGLLYNHRDVIIHYASQDLNIPLELILRLGARLNIIEDSYCPTVLFNCFKSMDFNSKAMKTLIDAGADFRIKNPTGKTCFAALRAFVMEKQFAAEIDTMERYAQENWKKLKREKTEVPSRIFTVQIAAQCSDNPNNFSDRLSWSDDEWQ